MVEASSSTYTGATGKKVFESQGPMSVILGFLGSVATVTFQQVNKVSYERIIPAVTYNVPIPSATLVLERKRKEFYLSRWTDSKHLKYWPLLKIGTG